ncbi:MAG: hypothetical protein PHE08_11115 [Bacteroidales bacterium]|jgi:hypothetical protein|nr:hypothetical protein [Bacteroidales bacterium]MDY0160011.1 hypothetical protein [Bacteroidales bacterium]
MAKNKTNIDISLQIIAIETLDFSLFPFDNKLMPLNTFHFNINLEQQFVLDKNLVFVIPKVDIMHENNETKLGTIKIKCIFNIKELSEFCDSKTKKVTLPEPVVSTLNSISISTCRGVMASQFKGTILNNAILPLIDPKLFSSNHSD